MSWITIKVSKDSEQINPGDTVYIDLLTDEVCKLPPFGDFLKRHLQKEDRGVIAAETEELSDGKGDVEDRPGIRRPLTTALKELFNLYPSVRMSTPFGIDIVMGKPATEKSERSYTLFLDPMRDGSTKLIIRYKDDSIADKEQILHT